MELIKSVLMSQQKGTQMLCVQMLRSLTENGHVAASLAKKLNKIVLKIDITINTHQTISEISHT